MYHSETCTSLLNVACSRVVAHPQIPHISRLKRRLRRAWLLARAPFFFLCLGRGERSTALPRFVNREFGNRKRLQPVRGRQSSRSDPVRPANFETHFCTQLATTHVNVTTLDPGLAALARSSMNDSTWGIRAVNTQPTDGFGSGIGGIAYLKSFSYNQDTPVFTFNKGARNGGMTNSHEVGHALGLRDQGVNSQSYHPGTGTGQTSWGPILGAPFGKRLTQWSNSDYDGATIDQDDLTIITSNRNGFGYRDDDHGSRLRLSRPTNASRWHPSESPLPILLQPIDAVGCSGLFHLDSTSHSTGVANSNISAANRWTVNAVGCRIG